MIRSLLKLFAYTQAPKTSFAFLHPVKAAQVVKTPFDLRTAYAPRLTAVATALLVGPLAYRLGKRAGEGTLRTPASDAAGRAGGRR
ncbi:MAG TPA: hypothetical protein VGR37_10140 [Longimicrobiaceae bacterium]|nr:hypothetical protein [Longimicrobiaceae bacterium]